MALITLLKAETRDPAIVGEPFFYTLQITNLGPDPALNVTVTDQLPATVTFVRASVPCAPGAGQVVTCTLGTIPARSQRTVTIEVTPTQAGTITNLAIATGANTNTVQDVETARVLGPAQLSIRQRTNPDPAFVGETLTYIVSVFNRGPAPAVDVLLVDDLPPTVAFVSSNVLCTLGAGTNQILCNLGNIEPLTAATVEIEVEPTEPGSITNTARATGTNTNIAEVTVTTQVILAADLAVTKTANARAQVNDGLTYTVTVVNNGPSTATGVTLVDTMPAGVRFISVTASQGSCAIAGFRLTCFLGALSPGSTATATILVVPTGPGIVTNPATVSGNEFDPNPGNNMASVTTTVLQCAAAE